MLDLADFEDAKFFEGPGREFASEGLVGGLFGLLVRGGLDGGGEPLVFEGFCAAEDGETSAVAGLEGGNEVDLRASGEDVFCSVGILFGVVDVGCGRGLDDGSQQRRGIAEHLTHSSGEGHNAVDIEVTLDVLAGGCDRNCNHIVLLRRALSIVVEVVNDQAVLIGRQADVEFGKEAGDCGRNGILGGQGDEDVGALVDKVDKEVRGQCWAKTLGFGGEDQEMGGRRDAMGEEGERGVLW